MDLTKTRTAINEFQNAVDKQRALMTMVKAAETLWTELGSIDDAQLTALAAQKDGLTNEVASLTDRRDQLKGAVDALGDTLKARQDLMDRQLQQRKEAADAEHAASVAKMRDEIAALQAERESLAQQHAQFMEQAATARKELQQQISQLKSQATAIAHA